MLELFILKAIEELKMYFEKCTHVNGGETLEKIHAIEILIRKACLMHNILIVLTPRPN